MKFSTRQKLLLLSILILAGIGFVGYAVYKSNQRLLDSEYWVKHTEQIIYQSGNILAFGKYIESASRGFVITNDSSFLSPFYNAEKTSLIYIRQLRQLVRDNPIQQQRIDSLHFYMNKRLAFSLQMIEIRKTRGLASAIAYTSTKRGMYYTSKMRSITNAIKREELTLLQERKRTNAHSVAAFNQFAVFIFILMAVSVILLLIVTGNYLLLGKEKRKRDEELVVANKELLFQNQEKENRAAELVNANRELKKAEDDVRKLNEDLEQKVIERTEQLESVNKELGSFSYSVSHDLRAPLRAIHGYTNMLKEYYITELKPEAVRLMNNIVGNAKKMGQLIDDLLAFSRLGRKELVKMTIPMNEMVSNLCNEVKTEFDKRNIQFNINKLVPAQGDLVTLKQVWVNLISNAVKYSAQVEKTSIEIGSEIKGKEIIYFIKDNGAGFDMRYADKLFGVFQRLHTEEKFEGTGVGLAIVHRIILKHGGRVWAESKVNKGATFYFSLPLT